MDPQHFQSNLHLYDDILSELQQQGLLRSNKGRIAPGRKGYAKLDIEQMGVDLKENFDSPDNKVESNKTSEIRYMRGQKNENDLYALPNKKREEIEEMDAEEERAIAEMEEKKEEEIEDKDLNKDLPPGWEKHEDNEGPYYWHIKSGTIQREPPLGPKERGPQEPRPPLVPPTQLSNNSVNTYKNNRRNKTNSFSNALNSIYSNKDLAKDSLPAVTRSTTTFALDQVEEEQRRREELAYKRRSYPLKSESESKAIRFAVRSLGWVKIAEEDLTPERSSKAVNKCIVDLSLGKNDLLDVVGRWGDGKDLFMDLDEGALKLIDPENLTILNTQPIHTIRVWGVGRDNGRERDFAYVARDRATRIHMCHVFRCDTAARTIANTLRDICKKIMIERTMQSDVSLSGSGSIVQFSARSAIRPTDLPTENRRWTRHPQSFPTPMEEPKKVMRCQYVGSTEVNKATGMDVLNAAIDHITEAHGLNEPFEFVNCSVAPSMISVTNENGQVLLECRVRYLSFLGIGQDIQKCAFIMHTAQDKFVAHVFHCVPSSGPLCKTIEAACKLRYQKCLDAHPNHSGSQTFSGSPLSSKGIGATIKSFVTSFTLKKDKFSS